MSQLAITCSLFRNGSPWSLTAHCPFGILWLWEFEKRLGHSALSLALRSVSLMASDLESLRLPLNSAGCKVFDLIADTFAKISSLEIMLEDPKYDQSTTVPVKIIKMRCNLVTQQSGQRLDNLGPNDRDIEER